MLPLIIIIVSIIILLVAAYVDIKTLEVPDWLNYAGIAAGLGIHLLFSVQQSSWWPIASSGIGFAIGMAIACLMFYTGQWGGGDAKLLMAMGALIGFEVDKFSFGANFLINLVFIGGAWGIAWSVMLAARNREKFWKTFKAIRQQKSYARLRLVSVISAAVFILASFIIAEYGFGLVILGAAVYLLCYLVIFIKSVEQSSMYKWVTPDKLTEGDWLVNDVKVGKIHIAPAKLGLEKEQLKQIQTLYKQKKLDKVFVKYGVPFTPAFLISFIVCLFMGNMVLFFIA